jgi:hypothetical protein
MGHGHSKSYLAGGHAMIGQPNNSPARWEP